MREIVTHKINDRQPEVFATGNVGPGGAEQSYRVLYPHKGGANGAIINIEFMSVERDGFSNEALLAILIDRLTGFQEGPFACEQNAQARAWCARALGVLNSRTLARMDRGVENTLVP